MNPVTNYQKVIYDCSINSNTRMKVLLIISSNKNHFYQIDTNAENRPVL